MDTPPKKKKVEEGHKYHHVKILSQLKFRIMLTQIANSYLEKIFRSSYVHLL